MISVGIQKQGGNSDNIKREILLICPFVPSAAAFASSINNLPSFLISETDIPTFRSVSKDLIPVTYFIELINVGKGMYGRNGIVLTKDNLKLTSFGSSLKDISSLSTTQSINLGYTGVSVVDAINSQFPSIEIQDQNQGYVLINGFFENGIANEYLWIGSAGTYGLNALVPATTLDVKDFSGDGTSNTQNNFSKTIYVVPGNLSGNGTLENQICAYVNSLGYNKQDIDADVWIEYDSLGTIQPVNCIVSEWSDWSACRLDGFQTRTRSVVTPASNGGSSCPVLYEQRACVYVPPTGNRTQLLGRFNDPCGNVIENLWLDQDTQLYYTSQYGSTLYNAGYVYDYEGVLDQEGIYHNWSYINIINGVSIETTQNTSSSCSPNGNPPSGGSVYTLASAPSGGCQVSWNESSGGTGNMNIPPQDEGLSFSINVGPGGIISDTCGFS